MSIVLIAVARMLIAAVCIALLVACDDYTCRLWLGGGILGIATPMMIVVTTKIGFNSGYIRAEADMIRAHCALGQEEEKD